MQCTLSSFGSTLSDLTSLQCDVLEDSCVAPDRLLEPHRRIRPVAPLLEHSRTYQRYVRSTAPNKPNVCDMNLPRGIMHSEERSRVGLMLEDRSQL